MGKRARRGGITNRAVRAARAALQEQDTEAHDIANRVYLFAVHHKRDEEEPLPLKVWAPAQVAAELSAPGAAKLAGLPLDETTVLDVAAYLLAGFREMAVQLDPEHFRAWQRTQDELERGAATGSADPSSKMG